MHLHARSSYTLLQSTLSITQLIEKSRKLGFSSVTLSDNDVMFGTLEFIKKCRKANMKPIIGLETLIIIDEELYGFELIAKNKKGYENLIKISSKTSSKEYLTIDELATINDIYIISYGEGGYFDKSLVAENEQEILARIDYLTTKLNDFYIAISMNENAYWRAKNLLLKKCARKCGVKTVALNKIYYENEEDGKLLKIVTGIREQKTINDSALLVSTGRYILSNQEMIDNYDEDDLIRVKEIEDSIVDDYELPKTKLPKYETPNDVSSKDYLTQLCIAGLKKRMDNKVSKVYADRLKYELDIIINMHFEDYFLIVYDFIKYARKQGIYVGPGRGSAAGSLVSYCLGIVHIDPIKYNLLFERFLNPERISMPDIDTDFPDDRRDEVINYVLEKYGTDHIAHIITFGTLGAKQVIRDVGKVMEISIREIDMIAKAIPNAPKVTLRDAYEQSNSFRQMIESNRKFRELFNVSLKLEGLPRHASTHAAGIVMSNLALNDVVPTIKIENEMVSTQYTAEYLEELGLIKMDFLGLRNLTTINEIETNVKKDHPDFNIMQIPLDDPKTINLVKNVDTTGIFQLESEGMKSLLEKMKPTCFNDIVVTIALFRPGPMENIPVYLEAKNNPSKVVYPHKDLKPILEETYGIFIYQEQIMKAAQVMAGFSLGKADILRKAMSKKKAQDLINLQEEFISGCLNKGYDEKTAHVVYDIIMKFAGYGFNKAHSVAYALLAYQLAYLKANYPYTFYCSLLNSVIGADNKSAEYIDECRRKGISILKPSINKSTDSYIIEEKAIRFPLTGIKNVSYTIASSIVEERSKGLFTDFYDFVARITTLKINRKVIESLIDAGALDEFDVSRKSLLMSLDEALNYAQIVQIDNNGQVSIDLGLVSKPVMILAKDDVFERSNREKEVLGFFLGEHPIFSIKKKYHISLPSLATLKNKSGYVKGFACINRIKQHRTKKGDLMAFVSVSDESGDMDIIFMPNTYGAYQSLINKGQYLYFNGKLDDKGSCIIRDIQIMKVNLDD